MNKSNTLIGINGKIGSGKDTVGNIIQYLTANNYHFSIVERIKDGLHINGYHDSKWEIKKFAGKLKQVASILSGVSIGKFEDQSFKKLDMGSKWGMTYREFLQKLGTDAMRDNLHKNIWVNALFADYHSWSDGSKSQYRSWVITDMRFPNEMEAIKERKGITIRVVRPQIETAEFKSLHPSETALDDAKFDYEITNDGSIEDLIKNVELVLTAEGIL